MPAPVQNLLNPSIGINELLSMPEVASLPQAKDLSNLSTKESGLEGLYGLGNSRTAFEAYLCPDVGDGRVVSPEVFASQLASLIEKLKGSENPKVRALLENEIIPLVQNGALLNAYCGLMLGG